jgi:site-specific DNA-cytosine methylase
MQENLVQAETNTQNENDRETKNEVIRESKDKNDSIQLSSRYLQYTYAKRHLRGTRRPEIFPIASEVGEVTQARDVAGTLQADYWKRDRTGGYVIETQAKEFKILSHYGHKNKPVVEADTVPTLKAQSHGHQPMVIEAQRCPLKFLKRNQKNIVGDYSYTVDSLNTGGIKINGMIRLLTPTECERLQGFPDGWTEGVSDTQRYKCLGNAVTTNVIEYIGRQLVKFIE